MKLLIAAAVGLAAGYLFRRHQESPCTCTTTSYPSVWGDTHTDDFPQWTYTYTSPAT